MIQAPRPDGARYAGGRCASEGPDVWLSVAVRRRLGSAGILGLGERGL